MGVNVKNNCGSRGMFLMPWVCTLVRLGGPTAQKACRGYPLFHSLLRAGLSRRSEFITASPPMAPLLIKPTGMRTFYSGANRLDVVSMS